MTTNSDATDTPGRTEQLPKDAARPRRPETRLHQPPDFDVAEKETTLGDIVDSGSGHPATDLDSKSVHKGR